MEHHENNGHGHGNDHDHTEGKRQYYPKGWWIPLAGLVLIALCISLGGGALLGISGTDKWGHSEKHVCNEHCGPDCKEKAACEKECHDKGGECTDKHMEGGHHEAAMNAEPKHDSMPAADTGKHEAAKPAAEGEHH